LPVRIREALRRLGKGAATELPLRLLIGCQDQPNEREALRLPQDVHQQGSE
jgi:hypothetical protein